MIVKLFNIRQLVLSFLDTGAAIVLVLLALRKDKINNMF